MLAKVPFNLLPKFLSVITDPGERQLNEPGFNALDNCGPAAGSVLMQVLGYQDIEPQAWTDYEYWPTYRGGETYEALNDFIASHYPNPPAMSIESPGDQLAAIDQWGSAGLLVIGLFWSNSAAQFQPRNTGIGHFALILGYDGTNVTVWNPELGVQDLSVALFDGASQNLYDVCHRPISSTGATAGSEIIAGGLMTRGQKVNAVEDWYAIYLHLNYGDPDWPGGADKAGPDITQWANQIQDDGENLDAIRGQFIAAIKTGAPDRYAWFDAAKRPSTTVNGSPGPAGPPGPPGPPGTPAPAVTQLKVSGTLDVIQ